MSGLLARQVVRLATKGLRMAEGRPRELLAASLTRVPAVILSILLSGPAVRWRRVINKRVRMLRGSNEGC